MVSFLLLVALQTNFKHSYLNLVLRILYQPPHIIRYLYLRNGWAMITILALTGSSSQMLITYQIQVFAINHVRARDKNVHPSDLCNYQTFVPNFRQLVPSPLKMMCEVPDLEHTTTYPCCHWLPNFSPRCYLNQIWQGFK